jgi:hypothetical protein
LNLVLVKKNYCPCTYIIFCFWSLMFCFCSCKIYMFMLTLILVIFILVHVIFILVLIFKELKWNILYITETNSNIIQFCKDSNKITRPKNYMFDGRVKKSLSHLFKLPSLLSNLFSRRHPLTLKSKPSSSQCNHHGRWSDELDTSHHRRTVLPVSLCFSLFFISAV